MASWQSQFIKLALRTQQISQGHLKREVWDENTSVPAFREMVEKGAANIRDLRFYSQIRR